MASPTTHSYAGLEDILIPTLEEYQRFHVFISYCTKDQKLVKYLEDYISQFRDRHGNQFKFISCRAGFSAGKFITENIEAAIQSSRKMLLILTENSVKSSWVSLEVAMNLLIGNERGRVNILPFLENIDENHEAFPKSLKLVNFIRKNDQNWQHQLFRALAAPDVLMKDVLPVGNVGFGLALSYFFGYLQFVLPALEHNLRTDKEKNEKAIEDIWNDDITKRRIARKLFILIPRSGTCYGTLSENDSRIIKVHPLQPVIHSRAGNFKRTYQNHVYKISLEGKDPYYCVIEYATPVMTLHDMTRTKLVQFPPDQCTQQVVMFGTKLQEFISHSASVELGCHNRCIILCYDDKTEDGTAFPIAEMIVKEIERELAIEREKAEFAHRAEALPQLLEVL